MLAPNTPTRSSRCWDHPECVEVIWRDRRDRPWWRRILSGGPSSVEVRDTKRPEVSPAVFTVPGWRRWLRDVVMPGRWMPAADGAWRLADLAFTRGEVDMFREGVLVGEFDVARRVAP